MQILLHLAYTFIKVGSLTIGGGLAMLPIIQHEMERRGWLTQRQFLDILAVAEMTPGPIMLNVATYVGYRVAGGAGPETPGFAVAGALVGTVAVCLPSLFCVNLLSGFWQRNRNHPCMARIFGILRPLVTGLVGSAALLLAATCLWGEARPGAEMLRRFPDFPALALVAITFALTVCSRISPVQILLGGAAAGLMCGLLGLLA